MQKAKSSLIKPSAKKLNIFQIFRFSKMLFFKDAYRIFEQLSFVAAARL